IGCSTISTFGALPGSTLTFWNWLMKPGGGSICTVWVPAAMPRIRDGSRSVRDSPSSFHCVMPGGVTYRSKPVFGSAATVVGDGLTTGAGVGAGCGLDRQLLENRITAMT